MALGKTTVLAFGLGFILAGTAAAALHHLMRQPGDATAVAGVAIFVSDLDKSVTFYGTLGLTEKETVGQTPRRHTRFNMDAAAGLQLYEAPLALHPYDMGTNYIRIVYKVDNIAAVCARMAATSLPCLAEPRPAEKSLIADLRDPDGYAVQIVQQTK